MRDVSTEDAVPLDGLGSVPTNFAMQGPTKVPRIDYERIFVLDEDAKLLGEYALRDDCPLGFDDLRRSIPLNGMRHVVSFYQGEYAFTPFRVESLWFVVLTRGVPRIEDRASIGTLLAAMRVHLPPSLSPVLAAREAALRDREGEMELRESLALRREQRVTQIEGDLEVLRAGIAKREANVRARETRLNALRDFDALMTRTFPRAESERDPTEAQQSPSPARAVVPPPP